MAQNWFESIVLALDEFSFDIHSLRDNNDELDDESDLCDFWDNMLLKPGSLLSLSILSKRRGQVSRWAR